MSEQATETVWHGCYDGGWKWLIVEEAFAHPAKFSRALISRIYEHAMTSGYLNAGDTVVDPFGGVALGGMDACMLGLHWIGCELEPRFVALAEQNIALWNRYQPSGTARIVQGDSRNLSAVLQSAGAIVSSPPYADQNTGKGDGAAELARIQKKAAAGAKFGREITRCAKKGKLSPNEMAAAADYGTTPGQLGALPAGDVSAVVSAPPFLQEGGADKRPRGGIKQMDPAHTTSAGSSMSHYGTTEGNLGSMPEGNAAAVVSSPPYGKDTVHDGNGIDQSKLTGNKAGKNTQAKAQGYGQTPGNLSGLVQGVVSSPPFMSAGDRGAADPTFAHKFNGEQRYSGMDAKDPSGKVGGDRNSETKRKAREDRVKEIANLGEIVVDSGATGLQHTETFWSAARLIVQQCFQILRPGGVAIWVCKDFVRNKARVPFSDQWRQLCESCGFVTVEWIKASLVKEWEENTLFNGVEKKRRERKSFFRRLAEKKGSPRIDHEDVIVMRKP